MTGWIFAIAVAAVVAMAGPANGSPPPTPTPSSGDPRGAADLSLPSAVSAVTARDLAYTYRPGCPVPPDQLRRVELSYLGYDGRLRRGTLVVREDVVATMIDVFSYALQSGFPIQTMRPAEDFQGSDERAMDAGNTSAFNCRLVVGDPTKLSQHAYGDAIDVNPLQNPYVTRTGVVFPQGSEPFLDRSTARQGVLLPGGPIPEGLRAAGWFWGARWPHPDYHHFSRTGL